MTGSNRPGKGCDWWHLQTRIIYLMLVWRTSIHSSMGCANKVPWSVACRIFSLNSLQRVWCGWDRKWVKQTYIWSEIEWVAGYKPLSKCKQYRWLSMGVDFDAGWWHSRRVRCDDGFSLSQDQQLKDSRRRAAWRWFDQCFWGHQIEKWRKIITCWPEEEWFGEIRHWPGWARLRVVDATQGCRWFRTMYAEDGMASLGDGSRELRRVLHRQMFRLVIWKIEQSSSEVPVAEFKE